MSHIAGVGSGDHHVINIHPGAGAAGAARMDAAPISRHSGEAERISDAYKSILTRLGWSDSEQTQRHVAGLIFASDSPECTLLKETVFANLKIDSSTNPEVETAAIAKLRSKARGSGDVTQEFADACFDERYGVELHEVIKQLQIDYPDYLLPSEILAAKLPQTRFVNAQYRQVRAHLSQIDEAPRLYLTRKTNLYFIPRDNLDKVSELAINNCPDLQALPSELGRARITHLRCNWVPGPADEQSAEVLDKMQASLKQHNRHATLKFVMAVLFCLVTIGGICAIITLSGHGIL